MHFLSNPLVDLALRHFDQLDPDQPRNADCFFETFGPGNLLNAKDRPHERFQDYEELLKLILKRHQKKYQKLHKGTPFYFLAWLAFDLKNYEKALFYLDAAISEDVRTSASNWVNRPAALFLSLNYENQVAHRVIEEIHEELTKEMDRFNAISGLSAINPDVFLDKFVRALFHAPSTRTIISAFYIFLLEFKERLQELSLRSTGGGSIGALISHMFSGGLIFESLLKYLYPHGDNGSKTETLGQIFRTTGFTNDFLDGISTRATSIKEIFNAICDDTLVTAFNTTAKLRNTTGHDLIWDDIFDNPDNFVALVNQEINALLYVTHRKFLQ
jgi:hypothetical protein